VQTHYDDRRLSFVAGIGYENDADEASQVIVDALSRTEGVPAEPPPEALVNELGVSTVNIEARFWTGPRQHESRLVLDLAIKAVKALDDAGIVMPADIIALQATPGFKATLQNDADVSPAGGVKARPQTNSSTSAGRSD